MSKVLYISYNDALGSLGHSQIIPYIKGLMKTGYEFVLLSYERENQTESQKNYMNELGIQWKPKKYHKYPSLLATTFDLIVGIVCSIYYICTQNIKIIHARSYLPALIGLFASKVTGAKLIFDMRGFMADEYAESGNWSHNSYKYKTAKSIEKIILKHAHITIALTYEAKRVIHEDMRIKKEISVIPCCVDIDRFTNPKKDIMKNIIEKWNLENKIVMIYTGSLKGWYLAEEMVNYFEVAKQKIPNLHFFILTNNDKHIIENHLLLKKSNKNDYTVMRADPSDIPEYLGIADFAISFQKKCFSIKASSPIKFGEYLAAGIPIVTCCGIGDADSMINNDIGVILNSLVAEEFESSVDHIIELLKKKNETSNKCLKLASESLSLKIGVESYKKIYDELLSYDSFVKNKSLGD